MQIYRGPIHNGGCYSTIAVIFVLWIIIYCIVADRTDKHPGLSDAALIMLVDDSLDERNAGKIDSATTYDYYLIHRRSHAWGAAKVMAVKEDSLLIRARHTEEDHLWYENDLVNELNAPYLTFNDVWISRETLKKMGEGRYVKDPVLVRSGLDSAWITKIQTIKTRPEMRVVFYQKGGDSDLWVIRGNWMDVQFIEMKDYNNNVRFLKDFPMMLKADTGVLFSTKNPGKDQYEKLHFDLTCRFRTDSIFTFTVDVDL